MSVRAYDAAHMIIDASVCEGSVVQAEIERLLSKTRSSRTFIFTTRNEGAFRARSTAHDRKNEPYPIERASHRGLRLLSAATHVVRKH